MAQEIDTSQGITTIAELFQADPLGLSDQDIDEVVAYFRTTRKQFNAGAIGAGSTKPKTETQKLAAKLSDKLDDSLGDLLK